MGFNLLMLLGLAGLAIPVIVHLLNRRRYDVVDWGAMQFLKISETTRRRLLLEELLLLLVRMAVVLFLVLGLASLVVPSVVIPGLGQPPRRDLIVLCDGSYSMGYTGGDQTPHEAARAWANWPNSGACSQTPKGPRGVIDAPRGPERIACISAFCASFMVSSLRTCRRGEGRLAGMAIPG